MSKQPWLKSHLSQGMICIQDVRMKLMEEGYSAKQANQLTLEILRVKGEDIQWTD